MKFSSHLFIHFVSMSLAIDLALNSHAQGQVAGVSPCLRARPGEIVVGMTQGSQFEAPVLLCTLDPNYQPDNSERSAPVAPSFPKIPPSEGWQPRYATMTAFKIYEDQDSQDAIFTSRLFTNYETYEAAYNAALSYCRQNITPTLRGNCEGNISGLSAAYIGLFRAPNGDFFALDSHKYDLATTARSGYTPSGSELIGVTHNGIFQDSKNSGTIYPFAGDRRAAGEIIVGNDRRNGKDIPLCTKNHNRNYQGLYTGFAGHPNSPSYWAVGGFKTSKDADQAAIALCKLNMQRDCFNFPAAVDGVVAIARGDDGQLFSGQGIDFASAKQAVHAQCDRNYLLFCEIISLRETSNPIPRIPQGIWSEPQGFTAAAIAPSNAKGKRTVWIVTGRKNLTQAQQDALNFCHREDGTQSGCQLSTSARGNYSFGSLIGYRCNDGNYGVLAQQNRSQKRTEMLWEALAIRQKNSMPSRISRDGFKQPILP